MCRFEDNQDEEKEKEVKPIIVPPVKLKEYVRTFVVFRRRSSFIYTLFKPTRNKTLNLSMSAHSVAAPSSAWAKRWSTAQSLPKTPSSACSFRATG